MSLTILQNNAITELYEKYLSPQNSLHRNEDLCITVDAKYDEIIALKDWLLTTGIAQKAEILGQNTIRCTINVEEIKKYI